jgi:hypothetical protein
MGIANIVNTAGGGGGSSEIITHLVNSVDGAGLRLANQGYISCADVSANRFGTNDFSVEFVLSQETNAVNADIFISNLNGSNQAVDAAVIRWDVVQNDNIQLVFTNSSASETAYNFGYDPAPDLNEPTHYLVSADRSGNAVLYRNGAEIASVSIAASGSANVGNSAQPTVIGSPVNNFGVKGNVYRFRTYSKALSSEEAKNVFDRADVPTALVSNLLLDLDCAYANPTQSTVIQDRGPNNQDGTLNGTITQTNVIKQLNSVSARIGTTAATVADGDVAASGDVYVGNNGKVHFPNNAGTDSLIITNYSSSSNSPYFSADPANTAADTKMHFHIDGSEKMVISSTGETKITRAGDEPCLELSTNNAGCKLNFSRSGDPTAYIRMYEDGAVGTGSLRFATGSSATPVERLTISSTGNVQIGTGSLAAVGGGPTLGLVGAAPEITLRDSATGTPYAVMRTNDNGNLILEADSGDNAGSSGIEFKVDGATKATIASSGIGYFDVGGINLGDTNLSNYKEGSWTPTLVRNGAAITAGVAYTSANGNYTRVGNVVHYWFDMTIGTLDNSTLAPASGTFGIGGLPFTSAAAGNGGYGAPSFRSMTAVPTSIRNNNNSSFVQGSATYIALFWFNGSAVEIGLDDVTTDLTTGRLTGEGFYFTS